MNSCLRASDTVRRFAGSRMKIFSSKSAKCFNCTTNTTDARVRAHTHTYGQTTQTDTKRQDKHKDEHDRRRHDTVVPQKFPDKTPNDSVPAC